MLGPLNVRKFDVFFINCQVKFISLKFSIARDNLIISFMYENVSIISTGEDFDEFL